MKPIKITDNLGMEMGIGLATMADQIMVGEKPTDLSAKSVTKILSHIFDFRQRTRHESDSRLFEAMQESCGRDAIEYLGIRKLTARRLVGADLHDGYVRNPIHHLAALYTINKGLDGFQSMYVAAKEHERIKFSSAEAEPEKLKVRRKSRHRSGQKYIDHFNSLCQPEQQRLENAHRIWLSDQLRQNPNITRSELRNKKEQHGAMRHFSLVDTTFFEKHGPASKRHSRKCGIDALLTRLTEHLTRKYSLSIETSPMQRITKTYLLSNFPCESSPSLSLSSNEAQALIAKYAETIADFRKRIEEMQPPMTKKQGKNKAELDVEVAYA
ncbi:hypothetical protein F506_20110 [Herbaspirillum hiltneri N3]|uniref:Uncharacterized protein n=1 Tax=Herbaspirillum hiltneri N3 TaxID=1262470 RepID=A0ABN4I0G3_9BURK|nr:hypothetical protein [Herbaspirillum hiltneri]AKZ64650.1 hypothetical protein F506_20110 [Herbaspirillum hiltneri N3]